MMGMWPQLPGMGARPGMPGAMPGVPGAMPMGNPCMGMAPMQAMQPGMPMSNAMPVPPPGFNAIPTPSISESQRKYMQQIVHGMKTSDIGVVAHSLSQAVNEKVQMPDAFLATVKQWMSSRQESVAASSQMQLAQFIGAQAWANQVQANMQMLQTQPQPAKSDPGGSTPMQPESAGFSSSQGRDSAPYAESTPMAGDATPTILGGKTPALSGAQTPTVVPSDTVPGSALVASATFPTEPTRTQESTIPTSSVQRTTSVRTMTSIMPTEATLSERDRREVYRPPAFDDPPTFPEPTVPSQVPKRFTRRFQVERSAEEVADFLRQQEDDRASFQSISKHLKVASQKIRNMVEQNGELFAVEKDQVLLKDQRRKEALKCLVKQLVTSEMQKMEINPEKALDCIWSAAHFAIKATPGEVKKVFEKVAQTILRSKQKVPRGHFPANMPLALACIIDRAVYLARRTNQGGITALEKALGPSLDSILLSRWQLGRVRGSQFLANLFLAWERLGYFEDKHLEMCKKHLLVLVAFARPEGLPDPPHKEDGTGWYKVVARDPGEDKNTEPIASKERQKALGQLRAEAEKIEEPPSRRPEPRPHPETTEQFAEARERVMHAMGQMGLMPKEAPKDVKVTESESGPKASQVSEPKVVDDEEEALFGSAIYNSAVYEEEEEIFGSPQEVEETPDPKPAAKETPREAETLPYDNLDATQQYASQESQDPHGGLAATQPYQDEPSPKRQRLSGESKMDP